VLIRGLLANPEYSGYFNGVTRDIEDVEKDYIKFVSDIAYANGIQNIYDENGKIVPQAINIVRSYLDGDQAITSLADQKGIKPPAEMDALNLVYQTRNIRNTYAKRGPNGEVIPPSYEESFDILKAQNPKIQQRSVDMQRAVDHHNRVSKALENRKGFSSEPKSTDGVDLSDLTKVSDKEIIRVASIPSKNRTPDETAFLKRVYKEKYRMADSEIDFYLT